ncbi:hypothetical protein N7461_006861 [Penicillium sp. DV-2018c]|nr:hypothetical protein N7461_006861 [Penicillium sp. DV-2018c]
MWSTGQPQRVELHSPSINNGQSKPNTDTYRPEQDIHTYSTKTVNSRSMEKKIKAALTEPGSRGQPKAEPDLGNPLSAASVDIRRPKN